MRAAIAVRLLCILLGWALWSASGVVQGASFELGVRVSPSPVLLTNNITLRIAVTNVSPIDVTDLRVTNVVPASWAILNATNQFGSVTAESNVVVFSVLQLLRNDFVEFRLTAAPTFPGLFTNVVVAAGVSVTNVTNTTPVTVFASRSDLGVALVPPAPGAFVNDFVTYTMTVTNAGPDAASGVVLSNQLPAGALLVALEPNTNVFLTNQSLVFGVGTLAANSGATFQVTLQPTNAGTAQLRASVTAPDLIETNVANNTVTNSFVVSDFLPGLLVASVVSPQTYNPQTGLMEQTVRLENAGTNSVAAARVFVGGLTNVLFNAVGTNAGNPFVVVAGPIASGGFVDLVLEIFLPTRTPVANPVLGAAAITATTNAPPTTLPPNLTRIVDLGGGSVLVEFESVPGRSYTVVYADNVTFTNALAAQPPVVAPANRTQWIDDGPPKTISRITNGLRFYRVFLNP